MPIFPKIINIFEIIFRFCHTVNLSFKLIKKCMAIRSYLTDESIASFCSTCKPAISTKAGVSGLIPNKL